MRYFIILFCIIAQFVFGQSSKNLFFFDDTTGSSWENELKGDLYYTDLNGTTQYWSKTTPVGLDLNGAEMVTNAVDQTFEPGSEVITNGSFGSNITDWSGQNSTVKWYNTDWNAVGRTNCLLDSATTAGTVTATGTYVFQTGVRYKITYSYYIPATNTTTVKIQPRFIGGTNPLLTIRAVVGTWTTVSEYHTALANYSVMRFYQVDASDALTNTTAGDKIYIDDVSIKPVPYWASNGTHSIDTSSTYKYAGSYAGKVISTGVGDTTTNFISLAYTQFQPIVAGKKYTVEYWANAASPGDWASTTKPRYTLKIGSKSSQSDTIAVYPGLWEKVVYNFQATSAEVNTPIKIYCSQADTGWIDNFSIREAYDFSKWAWIKSSATGTNKMIAERFASNNGLKLSINTSNQLVAVVGDGTNTVTKTGTVTTLCNGSWHLVGLTASRTGNLQLYVDGVADGTATAITSLGSIVSTTAFQIGFLSADYFNGSIGEIQRIRHTDLALMDKTAAQIYARGYNSVNMYSSYTGSTIVGWWFKTGAATDASGMGNDLTGSGSPTISTLTGGYR